MKSFPSPFRPSKLIPAFAGLTFVLLSIPAALFSQTVIYSDNFSGSSAASIVGTSPDVRPGAEVWGGSAGVQADGSFSGDYVGVYLPLSMSAGHIYQLTATILTGHTWAGWTGMGFIAGDPARDAGRFADNAALDWFLIASDARIASFWAPDSSAVISATDYPQDRLLTFTISIDASNAAPSNWTLSGSLGYDNGPEYSVWPEVNGMAVNAGITSLSQVTGVGFGDQVGAGTIESFTLTSTAVPEPSSYAALIGGLALLGVMVRRRRAA